MDLENVRITATGRRRLLRVVVDADGGVSLDDITQVSRALSAELDATGAMGETPLHPGSHLAGRRPAADRAAALAPCLGQADPRAPDRTVTICNG